MANDKITIWNLALSAAGAIATISDPDETSREANLCRLHYDLVRDSVLKAAPWPSAETSDRLTLAATRDFTLDWVNTDPPVGWKYDYAHPTGMLAPRYLTTWATFKNGWSSGRQVNTISSNQKNAILHYTFRQEDVSKWDSGLTTTMVDVLGATLVQPLNGKVSLSERLLERAKERILITKTEIANEQHEQYDRIPEGIMQRGYDAPVSQTRYHYPFEEIRLGAV